MGGSFASSGNEASVFARYHFRPHFHQHAGFRLVAPERREEATRFVTSCTGQRPLAYSCIGATPGQSILRGRNLVAFVQQCTGYRSLGQRKERASGLGLPKMCSWVDSWQCGFLYLRLPQQQCVFLFLFFVRDSGA